MRDRYEIFEASQDMLICELDKLVQKQELTPQLLSYFDTLVDVIKDLNEIMADEDEKYNNSYNQYSGRSYPMNRSYRGNSYRNDYRDPENGYSKRSEKSSEMLEHLYSALDSASSEEERKRIRRMIEDIENGN